MTSVQHTQLLKELTQHNGNSKSDMLERLKRIEQLRIQGYERAKSRATENKSGTLTSLERSPGQSYTRFSSDSLPARNFYGSLGRIDQLGGAKPKDTNFRSVDQNAPSKVTRHKRSSSLTREESDERPLLRSKSVTTVSDKGLLGMDFGSEQNIAHPNQSYDGGRERNDSYNEDDENIEDFKRSLFGDISSFTNKTSPQMFQLDMPLFQKESPQFPGTLRDAWSSGGMDYEESTLQNQTEEHDKENTRDTDDFNSRGSNYFGLDYSNPLSMYNIFDSMETEGRSSQPVLRSFSSEQLPMSESTSRYKQDFLFDQAPSSSSSYSSSVYDRPFSSRSSSSSRSHSFSSNQERSLDTELDKVFSSRSIDRETSQPSFSRSTDSSYVSRKTSYPSRVSSYTSRQSSYSPLESSYTPGNTSSSHRDYSYRDRISRNGQNDSYSSRGKKYDLSAETERQLDEIFGVSLKESYTQQTSRNSIRDRSSHLGRPTVSSRENVIQIHRSRNRDRPGQQSNAIDMFGSQTPTRNSLNKESSVDTHDWVNGRNEIKYESYGNEAFLPEDYKSTRSLEIPGQQFMEAIDDFSRQQADVQEQSLGDLVLPTEKEDVSENLVKDNIDGSVIHSAEICSDNTDFADSENCDKNLQTTSHKESVNKMDYLLYGKKPSLENKQEEFNFLKMKLKESGGMQKNSKEVEQENISNSSNRQQSEQSSEVVHGDVENEVNLEKSIVDKETKKSANSKKSKKKSKNKKGKGKNVENTNTTMSAKKERKGDQVDIVNEAGESVKLSEVHFDRQFQETDIDQVCHEVIAKDNGREEDKDTSKSEEIILNIENSKEGIDFKNVEPEARVKIFREDIGKDTDEISFFDVCVDGNSETAGGENIDTESVKKTTVNSDNEMQSPSWIRTKFDSLLNVFSKTESETKESAITTEQESSVNLKTPNVNSTTISSDVNNTANEATPLVSGIVSEDDYETASDDEKLSGTTEQFIDAPFSVQMESALNHNVKSDTNKYGNSDTLDIVNHEASTTVQLGVGELMQEHKEILSRLETEDALIKSESPVVKQSRQEISISPVLLRDKKDSTVCTSEMSVQTESFEFQAKETLSKIVQTHPQKVDQWTQTENEITETREFGIQASMSNDISVQYTEDTQDACTEIIPENEFCGNVQTTGVGMERNNNLMESTLTAKEIKQSSDTEVKVSTSEETELSSTRTGTAWTNILTEQNDLCFSSPVKEKKVPPQTFPKKRTKHGSSKPSSRPSSLVADVGGFDFGSSGQNATNLDSFNFGQILVKTDVMNAETSPLEEVNTPDNVKHVERFTADVNSTAIGISLAGENASDKKTSETVSGSKVAFRSGSTAISGLSSSGGLEAVTKTTKVMEKSQKSPAPVASSKNGSKGPKSPPPALMPKRKATAQLQASMSVQSATSPKSPDMEPIQEYSPVHAKQMKMNTGQHEIVRDHINRLKDNPFIRKDSNIKKGTQGSFADKCEPTVRKCRTMSNSLSPKSPRGESRFTEDSSSWTDKKNVDLASLDSKNLRSEIIRQSASRSSMRAGKETTKIVDNMVENAAKITKISNGNDHSSSEKGDVFRKKDPNQKNLESENPFNSMYEEDDTFSYFQLSEERFSKGSLPQNKEAMELSSDKDKMLSNIPDSEAKTSYIETTIDNEGVHTSIKEPAFKEVSVSEDLKAPPRKKHIVMSVPHTDESEISNEPNNTAVTHLDSLEVEDTHAGNITEFVSKPTQSVSTLDTVAGSKTNKQKNETVPFSEGRKPALSLKVGKPPSPKGNKPPSPKGDKSPLPKGDKPPLPKGDKPLSPKGDRPLSPRVVKPPSPNGNKPWSSLKKAYKPVPQPSSALVKDNERVKPAESRDATKAAEKKNLLSPRKEKVPVSSEGNDDKYSQNNGKSDKEVLQSGQKGSKKAPPVPEKPKRVSSLKKEKKSPQKDSEGSKSKGKLGLPFLKGKKSMDARYEGHISPEEAKGVAIDEGDEEALPSRINLREWNPTKLLKDMYTVKLAKEEVEDVSDKFISMEGLMEKLPMNKKKSTLLKTWKRRFFRAKDGWLHYFETSSRDKPSDSVQLMGGHIEDLGNRILGIDDGRGRFLAVRCPTDKEYGQWKLALESQTVDNVKATYIRPVLKSPPNSKRKVVLIDIGSCSIRAGILGEQATVPRVFFPSVVARNKDSGEITIGIESYHPDIRKTSAIMKAVRPTNKMDKDHMKAFNVDTEVMPAVLEKIFKELQVDPSQYWIMMSTPQNLADQLKASLFEILVGQFRVKGICMVMQSLLALYSYQKTSGILVDIGQRMEILPICDGYVIEGGVTRQSYGGQKVADSLNSSLTENKYVYVTPVEQLIVRYIMEQSCYVAKEYKDMVKKCDQDPESCQSTVYLDKFDLPDGAHMSVTHDRSCFHSPEGFFDTDLWGMDYPCVHKLVFKAIQHCPIDSRKHMYRAVYLSGGVTMLPGFAERLQTELTKLAPPSVIVEVHASPQRYHAAYLGACSLANMDMFEQTCISADEWAKNGAKAFKKWSMQSS